MDFAVRLKEYQTTDREAVIRLDKVALADIDALGRPRKFDDLQDIELEYQSSGAFVVAESDSGIVGMGGIRFSPDRTARVKRMRVHPERQGFGIGKMILAWLEEKALHGAIRKIVLNTLAIQKDSQEFYESLGYIKVGEGTPDGFAIFSYEKRIDHKQSLY